MSQYAGIAGKGSSDMLFITPRSHTRIDGLGTGNSSIIYDILPDMPSPDEGFQELMREVSFEEMSQAGGLVPRLVALQGIPYDAQHPDNPTQLPLWPLYRHPIDCDMTISAMTPYVLKIKNELEKIMTGQIFNHVLIQLYRNGMDHINEHSDKTVDISRGTSIVNYSVGASRTFVLRAKKDPVINLITDNNGTTEPSLETDVPTVSDLMEALSSEEKPPHPQQKISLRNNSAFICSWETNQQYLHGIRPDKRLDQFKHEDELLCSGMRISLTFRTVSTYQLNLSRCPNFYSPYNNYLICGQGAKMKGIPTADTLSQYILEYVRGGVSESASDESLRMLAAFSKENRETNFDWDLHYGRGFNIVKVMTKHDTDNK
jgi:2OG-Fe(II) oxygenase superfamily